MSLYSRYGGCRAVPYSSNFLSLDEDQVVSLEDGISEEVRYLAVGGRSCSGVGWFPNLVFKTFCDLVKRDLTTAFMKFLIREIISKDVGASFIKMVPKKDGAVELNDFCPLCLLGSPYKILARC